MYGSSVPTTKSKPKKKPPTMKKISSPSRKSLSESQEKRLKKHSEHHTKKHMAEMRKDMIMGMSFKMAHEKAQKKVGK